MTETSYFFDNDDGLLKVQKEGVVETVHWGRIPNQYFIDQDGALSSLDDLCKVAGTVGVNYKVHGNSVDVLNDDGSVKGTFTLHTLEQAEKFLK